MSALEASLAVGGAGQAAPAISEAGGAAPAISEAGSAPLVVSPSFTDKDLIPIWLNEEALGAVMKHVADSFGMKLKKKACVECSSYNYYYVVDKETKVSFTLYHARCCELGCSCNAGEVECNHGTEKGIHKYACEVQKNEFFSTLAKGYSTIGQLKKAITYCMTGEKPEKAHFLDSDSDSESD
ncbi:MAG: hypothetical protein NTY55_02370 [Flavobacteriia bacterium]|nr:hypothetical protein [Flavobacteriia bacterium]